jgi:hypothetical protein
VEIINELSKDKPITIAEVGVWKGELTEQILKRCPNVRKYYLVDPWRNLDDWNKPFNIDNSKFTMVYLEVMGRIDDHRDRIEILRGTTLEVIDKVKDEELDFIYIDGDHTAKGITIDMLSWPNKVKKDGIVMGDDYYHEMINNYVPGYDPTMIKPVVDGYCLAKNISLVSGFTQFAFVKNKEEKE